MERVTIPSKSWVVVCDGAKALFLRNDGDAERVKLQVVEALEIDNPAGRDQGTDRPGRIAQSMTAGRSAMEETDFHEAAEADFLKRIAEKMSDMAYAKTMERVVLVAPPKALGLMRPYFSTVLLDSLAAEVAKDLVKQPVDAIERHLKG